MAAEGWIGCRCYLWGGFSCGSLAPGWHCSLENGVREIFPLMGCGRELEIMIYLVVVMVVVVMV